MAFLFTNQPFGVELDLRCPLKPVPARLLHLRRLLVRETGHIVLVTGIHLYIFCQDYRESKMRRGKSGPFEIIFQNEEGTCLPMSYRCGLVRRSLTRSIVCGLQMRTGSWRPSGTYNRPSSRPTRKSALLGRRMPHKTIRIPFSGRCVSQLPLVLLDTSCPSLLRARLNLSSLTLQTLYEART